MATFEDGEHGGDSEWALHIHANHCWFMSRFEAAWLDFVSLHDIDFKQKRGGAHVLAMKETLRELGQKA